MAINSRCGLACKRHSESGEAEYTNRVTLSPIEALARYWTSPTEHHTQWQNDTAPLFSRLLEAAQYDVHDQYQYLLFMFGHIIPSLGPYPQRWKSTMTTLGIPLEFSINYQKHGKETVRVALEPVSVVSGTDEDPFNLITTRKFMSDIANLGLESFDMELHDYLINAFFPSANEIRDLQASGYGKRGGEQKSPSAFGFDLKAGGCITVKGYCHLLLKHLATGTPVSDIVREPLVRLCRQMTCSAAFDLMHDYLTKSSGYIKHTFLSWDYVPKEKSRLKVYSGSTSISLEKAEEVWSLGGRVQGEEISEGIKLIKQLWKTLGLKSCTDNTAQPVELEFDVNEEAQQKFQPPLTWNYELQPGISHPLTKLYFPVHGMNDLKVAEALSKFFHFLGWHDQAESYLSVLRDL
ncbi:putative dimethylallyl tryptophan synthase [Aspergillus fischeri NRRL 181]|uniref:Dimethylallyl tryptophan synthase, putative n=2 Tax=Aspergillus fischeri TaxID=36630 RepID=A1CUW9_NEOFI|nr:dimethylallyl tryptophan synthase, putative [Aspergillus fischeri NRRL 181]EAW25546.1 dimethylallyl tryptophan synthase, putative [Aspergillus fischeri NRRL 181]